MRECKLFMSNGVWMVEGVGTQVEHGVESEHRWSLERWKAVKHRWSLEWSWNTGGA